MAILKVISARRPLAAATRRYHILAVWLATCNWSLTPVSLCVGDSGGVLEPPVDHVGNLLIRDAFGGQSDIVQDVLPFLGAAHRQEDPAGVFIIRPGQRRAGFDLPHDRVETTIGGLIGGNDGEIGGEVVGLGFGEAISQFNSKLLSRHPANQ